MTLEDPSLPDLSHISESEALTMLQRIERVVRSLTRDDVIDDVTQAVWLRLATEGRDSSTPRAIIVNDAIDEFRRLRRIARREALLDELPDAPEDSRVLDSLAHSTADIAALGERAALGPTEFRVIYMHAYTELTFEQISARLGKPEKECRRMWHDALGKLRAARSRCESENEEG